jgi:hypothetical protein
MDEAERQGALQELDQLLAGIRDEDAGAIEEGRELLIGLAKDATPYSLGKMIHVLFLGADVLLKLKENRDGKSSQADN